MSSDCKSRNTVIFIVFVALLLDNLLLTSIVPILPNYFRAIKSAKHLVHSKNFSGSYIHELTASPVQTEHYNVSDHDVSLDSVVPLKSSLQLNIWPERSNKTDNENTKMGLLLGVKTFSQLLCNFFVGKLTNKIGYTIPMFVGFIILLASTVLFAFANSYWLLFAARAIQGMGTALSTTSGMGLLAVLFPEQNERAWAQTIAFSGLAAGVLIGPPYGGALYDLTGGKEIPCLILAAITLFEGVFQLIIIRPRYHPEDRTGSGYIKLLCDPFILITAAAITMASLNMAIMEPVLPIWMFHTMGSPAWQQGLAFVPATLSYLVTMQICGNLSRRCQWCGLSSRYLTGFFGIFFMGASIAAVPFCENIYQLIAPLTVNGIGFALVSSSMLPHIGYLVDARHEPVYGSAYALTDNAFCFAFAIGPALSGPMVDSVGFRWTLVLMATVVVILSPCVCLLKIVDFNETRRTLNVEADETSPLIPDSEEKKAHYVEVPRVLPDDGNSTVQN